MKYSKLRAVLISKLEAFAVSVSYPVSIPEIETYIPGYGDYKKARDNGTVWELCEESIAPYIVRAMTYHN